MQELSRDEARRIAVRAQLLTAERPHDLHEVVGHLFAVDVDAVRAVAPSQELVLWSRLGSAYREGDLADALDTRTLVELRGQIRLADDIALYREEMARWPGIGELKPWQVDNAAWVEANDACRRDLLTRLEDLGPTPSRELPDTCAVPWRSSGWSNDKNVTRMLEFMVGRGEVAVSGHRGRDRLWDLADRVYPDEPAVPLEEAILERARRRLAALGVTRRGGPANPVEILDVSTAGVPARVEGLRGEWRLDPAYLDEPTFVPRAALLSPLDRLHFDRQRMAELFDFDFQVEMYKPKAKRQWGYYALPVLVGDRLVGKLDATADREARVLRVDALHEDEPFDEQTREQVNVEIQALARWLGLDLDVR